MKFHEKMVCFQEVPSETSLSYSITNCKIHCPGCHSQYLWADTGIDIFAELENDLKYNKGLVTCILFLGGYGEDQRDDLKKALKMCREAGYKTALYTGYEFEEVDQETKNLLDYLKVGPYIETAGPLNKPTTNQRMYRIIHRDGSYTFEDITHKFWDRKLPISEV